MNTLKIALKITIPHANIILMNTLKIALIALKITIPHSNILVNSNNQNRENKS